MTDLTHPDPVAQAALNRLAKAKRLRDEAGKRVQDARDAHAAARRRYADAQTEYVAARFAAGHWLKEQP